MEEYVLIVGLVALLALLIVAPAEIIDTVEYHYQCITIQGELVYTDKKPNKNMVVKTPDGRTVKLKEYRQVPKE